MSILALPAPYSAASYTIGIWPEYQYLYHSGIFKNISIPAVGCQHFFQGKTPEYWLTLLYHGKEARILGKNVSLLIGYQGQGARISYFKGRVPEYHTSREGCLNIRYQGKGARISYIKGRMTEYQISREGYQNIRYQGKDA